MKIAFDLDDTAWQYRTFFRDLAHGMKARGHQVGILTAHDDSIREADLRLWEARGFPPADFLYNNSSNPGPQGYSHRDWKQEVCRRNGIDVLFDDFAQGPNGPVEVWINMRSEARD